MNAGYKGKVYDHPGYVDAPYNPFAPTLWQDKLRELEFRFARWLEIGNVSREEGLKDVNWMMKTSYPGDYQVVDLYPDPGVGLVRFKLVFDDPEEETLWLLRWS